jgi:peroxiredoxin Q/BCP
VVGAPAPDFTAEVAGGGRVRLADLRGRIVVLYFYPRDHTPGCTQQACDFRDAWGAFQALGAEVLGVSRDGESSHRRFAEKHALPFRLLSDESGDLCRTYGVLVEKVLYGRRSLGIERSTFLIDRAGILRGVWRKVRVGGHVAEVLDAVRALG